MAAATPSSDAKSASAHLCCAPNRSRIVACSGLHCTSPTLPSGKVTYADLVQTRSRARAADCFLVHTHGSICESHRAALERYWRAALRGHGSLVVEACDAGASPFLPVLLRTVPVIAWREEWARGAARRRPGGQSTPPHLDRACVL